jgi:nitroimidazol reductase NimA-like FMN-containing flavoprotein (pyridoxamine 5'-phosphate oxidase superfamily)
MLVTLKKDQALEILAEKRLGRLGCIANGDPYIVPINYYYDDGFIYSHSLPGLKILALRQNPRGCLQVDQITSDLNWRSALAFGSFEEIDDTDQRAMVINRLLNDYPKLTPVESQIALDGGSPQVIAYRIRIDRVTGVAEE